MPRKTLALTRFCAVLVAAGFFAGAGSTVAEEPFRYEPLPPVICKLIPYNEDGTGGGILCTINGVPVGAMAKPCRAKQGRLVDQGNGRFACRIPVSPTRR